MKRLEETWCRGQPHGWDEHAYGEANRIRSLRSQLEKERVNGERSNDEIRELRKTVNDLIAVVQQNQRNLHRRSDDGAAWLQKTFGQLPSEVASDVEFDASLLAGFFDE